MSGIRPAWDWQTDRVYVASARRRLPRVRLITHTHTCPDGTSVVVTAQYIQVTGITLFRWTVDGVRVGVTSTYQPADIPPDWSRIDAEHATVAA